MNIPFVGRVKLKSLSEFLVDHKFRRVLPSFVFVVYLLTALAYSD